MKRLVFGGGMMLLAVLSACAKSEPRPTERSGACECASSAPVVDGALLAFLSKAKALHGEADVAEDRKDVPAALAALQRVLDTSGESPEKIRAPEREEVLADTRARMAELRAATGDFDKALADVNDGLTHAKGPSYFRGHLYEVMGMIEEKRAGALSKSNASAADVEAARKRAIDASEAAVKIQDEVITRAMEPRK